MSDEATKPDSVAVEWDEPGSGGVLINGRRVISFAVETDWSDTWNPKVDPVGLAFVDRLPRLVQEAENAYDTARRYSDDLRKYLVASSPLLDL